MALEEYLQPEFVRQVDAGNVRLFVGAGLSTYSRLPVGAELATFARERFGFAGPPVGPDDRDLFDACVIENKEAFVTRWLIEMLGKGQPHEVHSILAELPFKCIFTTNYDALLESKLRLVYGSDLLVIDDESDLAYQDAFDRRIVKLHGSVERPSTLRITRQKIEEMASTSNRLLQSLRHELSQGPFLFLGYSLNDFNWLSTYLGARSDQGGETKWPYVAVIKDAKPEFASRQDHLGIRVVPMDALAFLRELRTAVERVPKDAEQIQRRKKALSEYRINVASTIQEASRFPPLRLADDPAGLSVVPANGDPILSLLEKDSKLMLLGPIGSGKKTAVRRAAALLATAEDSTHLPVVLHLSRYSSGSLLDFARAVLRERLEHNANDLLRFLRDGGGFFVLEGFEAAAHNDRLVEELEEVAVTFRECKIVVTCNAEHPAFRRIAGFRQVWMAPLSPDEVRAIATHELQEEKGAQFARDLLGGHRIPLGAGIAAGSSHLEYFVQRPRPSQLVMLCEFWKNNNGVLPRRTPLYQQFIETKLLTRFQPASQPVAMRCLQSLAAHTFQSDSSGLITHDKARTVIEAALREQPSVEPDAILKDLVETRLLQKSGLDSLSFGLPGLSAFLMGNQLCGQADVSQRDASVASLMTRSIDNKDRPAQDALQFYATLMDDPAPLIETFVKRGAPMAAQSLSDVGEKVPPDLIAAYVKQMIERFREDLVDFDNRFVLERLDERCLDALLMYAGRNEPDVAVRRWAGRVICQQQTQLGMDRIIAEIEKSDSPARWECAWAMFEIGVNRSEAPTKLAEFFANRFVQLEYYGYRMEKEIRPKLTDAFLKTSAYMAGGDDNENVAKPSWIGALVEAGVIWSITRQVLDHARNHDRPDQDVALMFLGYLGGMGGRHKEIVEFLAAYLADSTKPNRFCAASSLGVLNATEHADLLWRLMETDPDPNVRLYCAVALDRLVVLGDLDESVWLPKAIDFAMSRREAGATAMVVPMLSGGLDPEGPLALVELLRRGTTRIIEKQAIAEQLAYLPNNRSLDLLVARQKMLVEAESGCPAESKKWLQHAGTLLASAIRRKQVVRQ
jgi:HEAT repeat protein